jgi:hypothetical protein
VKSSQENVVISMKTILYAIILSALILGFPQAAHADYEDGDTVPASVVAPLMAWVEAHTGVRAPGLPHVIASHKRLMNIVSRMRTAGRAQALYINGIVIVDSDSFDPEDTTSTSVLLHELVHYAQSFEHKASWQCAQSKEVEAYSLQNQWLEERNEGPFVNASWIARVSACPTPSSSVVLAQAD